MSSRCDTLRASANRLISLREKNIHRRSNHQLTFIYLSENTHIHLRNQSSIHSVSQSVVYVYWQHCSEALKVCWGFYRQYRSIYCSAGALLGGLGPLVVDRGEGVLNSVSVQDWLSLRTRIHGINIAYSICKSSSCSLNEANHLLTPHLMHSEKACFWKCQTIPPINANSLVLLWNK